VRDSTLRGEMLKSTWSSMWDGVCASLLNYSTHILYSRDHQLDSAAGRSFLEQMVRGPEHNYKSFVDCKLTARSPNRYTILLKQLFQTLLTFLHDHICTRAPACTLNAISSLLAPYTKSEFVLLGDWDMLKPSDQVLK
jgi:hypothetical protein